MAVWVFGFGVSRTFWGFGLEKIGDLEIFGAGLWGPALGLRAWAVEVCWGSWSQAECFEDLALHKL